MGGRRTSRYLTRSNATTSLTTAMVVDGERKK